ncbi:hypothetical protein TNCV_2937641 [Trichonephila clavipes]|nr:hypothetical protein TNCV_2937641 [Trichonephila clavipes]
MLNEKDKALLVKLFFMNKKSATAALRKFRLQRNAKAGKGPLKLVRRIKLVLQFEETESLEDRGVLIPSIKSVGIETRNPPRAVMYTGGHSALCRCWICDTLGMCHPLWWWICGTLAAEIKIW